ncbi:hypothetical protein NKH82_00050 [Mesorhizobium sp. M0915]|uniref:hypothetical protein n=1 Tax=Mesorhizobium sp. M0915 TaxID=2957027 RepID=UPI003338FDED
MQQIDVAILTCHKAATIDKKNAVVLETAPLKAVAEEVFHNASPLRSWIGNFVAKRDLNHLQGCQRGMFPRANDISCPLIK